MPRRIRDAKLRNSRPTRQEHLDRNEEDIEAHEHSDILQAELDETERRTQEYDDARDEDEEDKELADEGLFLSEEVLDNEEDDEIQRQEDEFVTELSAHLEGDDEP